MTKTYIISYDIVEDEIRTKLGQELINLGLNRIQYSVFHGLLTNTKLIELKRIILDIIKGSHAEILIQPLCVNCIAKSSFIQQVQEEQNEDKPKEYKKGEGVLLL
ncbi:MAG: CRISPR-associated endonuclease Cas2 [Candidatus Heimdallarchaeota archaeon]|nr:CRISPR-associated endonuclease Cas2 [Candidatus Heimdallarchaeota archaeon]